MKNSKGKKKKKMVIINKEESAENWCFVCKDGGTLLICDYKQCLKSYHPNCAKKDDTFLESESYWACARHSCSTEGCSRSSYRQCYTCTYAVCRRCLPAVDFLQVKGKNGLCSVCLKLALLIEENKSYDSDGDTVDFTDRETYETLFKEYYEIIKEEEGFDKGDIYAAQCSVKRKKDHQSGSDLEESDDKEEDEEQISDYDGLEDEEYDTKSRKTDKKRRSDREKCAVQSKKSNIMEFIGWASRPLTEFLNSVGKSTSKELSQQDVTSIVNDYVKDNKLFNPEKRKMIICDARLLPLFRRKTIRKHKVYDLLGAHFAENYDESEDEDVEDSEDGDNSEGITNHACKRQRKLDVENNSQKKLLESTVPQSCFASIDADNIKLVYLKRSLLQELVKQPKSLEEKVIGCFVRVKSDPHDYRSKTSHQLMQVIGVKTVSLDKNKTEVVLLFSAMPKEICVSLLSDDDFSQEECEDLRQKMVAGELERPTVGCLQQKANILHEDLTTHRIGKELVILKNLIDRANEKGWRRELSEYLEKKKRLQNPSEVSRLLADVPTVIPDINELNSDSKNDIKSDKGSPKSILQCTSSVPSEGWQDKKVSEEKTQQGHEPLTCEVIGDVQNAVKIKSNYVLAPHEIDNPESSVWCIRGPNGEQDKSPLSVLKRWSEKSPYASEFKVWKEGDNEENAIWLTDAISIAFPKK